MDQRPILDWTKDTSKKDRYGKTVQKYASRIDHFIPLDMSFFHQESAQLLVLIVEGDTHGQFYLILLKVNIFINLWKCFYIDFDQFWPISVRILLKYTYSKGNLHEHVLLSFREIAEAVGVVQPQIVTYILDFNSFVY